MKKKMLVVLMFVGFSLLLAACPPKFPNCKTDEDCKSYEKNEGKVVCVMGQCQECGKDEDCGYGKICKFNKCEIKPECTTDADCSGGMLCKNNKCVPECTSDSDCKEGKICEGVRCVPAQCAKNEDCTEGKVCESGRCVQKMPAKSEEGECNIESIHFEFDKYDITPEAADILKKNAECIKKKGIKKLVIEGNCDERGTTEYNMSLGQKRADAAKKYLKNLGINIKMDTISYGKEKPICRESNEECWAKNRRDDFVTK